MQYRIAKKCDAKTLALLHFECSLHQHGGFMHKLGIPFLKKYYEITSSNKNSLILIAENEYGNILGFHSGTLKAEEHFASLRKNRIGLFLNLVPQLITKPSLILDVIHRYVSFANKDTEIEFGVKTGPRGEYWGWLPDQPNPAESLTLHKKWHKIFRQLGAELVRSEVDLTNDRVYRSIKLMGGEIIRETTLPDGRRRAIVQYDLTKSY